MVTYNDPKSRPVIILGKEYPSILNAAKELGIARTTIHNRVNNPGSKWTEWQYAPESNTPSVPNVETRLTALEETHRNFAGLLRAYISNSKNYYPILKKARSRKIATNILYPVIKLVSLEPGWKDDPELKDVILGRVTSVLYDLKTKQHAVRVAGTSSECFELPVEHEHEMLDVIEQNKMNKVQTGAVLGVSAIAVRREDTFEDSNPAIFGNIPEIIGGPIAVTIRDLPESQICAEYEIVNMFTIADISYKPADTDKTTYGIVGGVVLNREKTTAHFRLQGIGNTRYRFRDNSSQWKGIVENANGRMVVAEMERIHYEIPEEGIPSIIPMAWSSTSVNVNGCVSISRFTIQNGSGEVVKTRCVLEEPDDGQIVVLDTIQEIKDDFQTKYFVASFKGGTERYLLRKWPGDLIDTVEFAVRNKLSVWMTMVEERVDVTTYEACSNVGIGFASSALPITVSNVFCVPNDQVDQFRERSDEMAGFNIGKILGLVADNYTSKLYITARDIITGNRERYVIPLTAVTNQMATVIYRASKLKRYYESYYIAFNHVEKQPTPEDSAQVLYQISPPIDGVPKYSIALATAGELTENFLECQKSVGLIWEQVYTLYADGSIRTKNGQLIYGSENAVNHLQKMAVQYRGKQPDILLWVGMSK